MIGIHGGSTSKRGVSKGAKRRAHRRVSGNSDVPLSTVKMEGGVFFYTLALADRGRICDALR